MLDELARHAQDVIDHDRMSRASNMLGASEFAGTLEEATPARASLSELLATLHKAADVGFNNLQAAAHSLGVSHSTVKHHLANARSKVGATKTALLVWIFAPRLPIPEGADPTDH
jgi:DNA-binding NarL/FixJ family response regulator